MSAHSEFRGVTYFRRWGFSINEGGTPLNLHVAWGRKSDANRVVGFYVYLFGLRLHKFWSIRAK